MTAPRVGFLIGGVQKAGTTALARYLAEHPAIVLPRGKEAHVFDAPDFDEQWTPSDIDGRYADHFDAATVEARYGDATPIYCFHPAFVRRIAAYNPAMRWILLLRHPVDRAISQYHMERARGDEHWPFWPAMLLERWRLRGHEENVSPASPMRHFSYRARGDYARQLDVLFSHFPREQVLLLHSRDLAGAPDQVLSRVFEFLDVLPLVGTSYPKVFEGHYTPLPRTGWRWRFLAWLMRRPLREARERYGLNLE